MLACETIDQVVARLVERIDASTDTLRAEVECLVAELHARPCSPARRGYHEASRARLGILLASSEGPEPPPVPMRLRARAAAHGPRPPAAAKAGLGTGPSLPAAVAPRPGVTATPRSRRSPRSDSPVRDPVEPAGPADPGAQRALSASLVLARCLPLCPWPTLRGYGGARALLSNPEYSFHSWAGYTARCSMTPPAVKQGFRCSSGFADAIAARGR